LAITRDHTTLSDEDLLVRFRTTGNNEWLGTLLQRYTMLLLGVAMKYMKEKALAEDAVQQVFLKALTSMPEGPILNFKGWLYILTRNHCLQQLRDRHQTANEIALEFLSNDTDERQEQMELDLSLGYLHEALAQLGAEQQTTITLFYLQKHSYEQIIAKTGFTFMQVKSHIQNGKRNLKTIMTKKLKEGA
jgi:RNA polymerase sigma-70 factor (ECF subfamily)